MYHGQVQSLSHALRQLFHPHRANQHRPKVLHPHAYYVYLVLIGVFYTVFAVIRLTPVAQSVLGFASNITADQVIDNSNQARAKIGLTPLIHNDLLSQAALFKAQYMIEHQYWAHTAPDGTSPWAFFDKAGYRYNVAGENLARDFANSDQMQAAWMASPTHRENILNPKYSETGIAVINGTLMGTETTLVVQLFGRPASVTPSVGSAVISEKATVQQRPNSLAGAKPQVLSSETLPVSSLTMTPQLSPVQLIKSVFLALLSLLLVVLVYDAFLLGHGTHLRLVGKNLAHILFFSTALFLILLFKTGVIDTTAITKESGAQMIVK